MPIFEYQCGKCGKKKEVLEKQRDTGKFCECGYWMRPIVSKSGFTLKGTGWSRDNWGGTS